MASFLVERFWPGMTGASAEAATAMLVAGGVDVIETIVAPPDEVCLWYIEAPSAGDVAKTFLAANVPFDRVSAADRWPR
jgi:hypothetical protein